MSEILQDISSEAKHLYDMINMRPQDFKTYFANSRNREEAALHIINKINKLAMQLQDSNQ